MAQAQFVLRWYRLELPESFEGLRKKRCSVDKAIKLNCHYRKSHLHAYHFVLTFVFPLAVAFVFFIFVVDFAFFKLPLFFGFLTTLPPFTLSGSSELLTSSPCLRFDLRVVSPALVFLPLDAVGGSDAVSVG
ncbi:hypothetical protein BJV82DRAFT_583520 [Fennellomyces sp. T-0311]|nr:hypothetical protein BJV82DRAFT_583520 [Fennellomyces sp. T-0311]